MENISIPPFYVGQEVVANRDHSLGDYKKGDQFIVNSIFMGCCGWEVTIGIIHTEKYTEYSECLRCNKRDFIGYGNQSHYNAQSFSPKLEIKDFISMKQLAEQQLELIAAN